MNGWAVVLVLRTTRQELQLLNSSKYLCLSAGLTVIELISYLVHCHRRHLEFFASPAALLQTYPSFPTASNPNPKPKLILAVPASLSHGPSRELFTEFAKVPGNMIVLTARGETGSLSRLLYSRWSAASGLDGVSGDGANVGAPIDLRGESLSLEVYFLLYLTSTILDS